MSTLATPAHTRIGALDLLDLDLREEATPVIEIEPCPHPNCACRGLGSVTLLASGSRALLEAHARGLASEGVCLLTIKAMTPKRGAAVSSAFYRGHFLCCLEAAPAGRVLAATVVLDLPALQPGSLSFHTSSDDQHLLLLHQAAALSPLERHVRETMPSDLRDSPGTLLSRKGVLVLLQPGGWALGGFLAKAALLRQREHWRAQSVIAPDHASESAVRPG